MLFQLHVYVVNSLLFHSLKDIHFICIYILMFAYLLFLCLRQMRMSREAQNKRVVNAFTLSMKQLFFFLYYLRISLLCRASSADFSFFPCIGRTAAKNVVYNVRMYIWLQKTLFLLKRRIHICKHGESIRLYCVRVCVLCWFSITYGQVCALRRAGNATRWSID